MVRPGPIRVDRCPKFLVSQLLVLTFTFNIFLDPIQIIEQANFKKCQNSVLIAFVVFGVDHAIRHIAVMTVNIRSINHHPSVS